MKICSSLRAWSFSLSRPQFNVQFFFQVTDQFIRIVVEHLVHGQLTGHVLTDNHYGWAIHLARNR